MSSWYATPIRSNCLTSFSGFWHLTLAGSARKRHQAVSKLLATQSRSHMACAGLPGSCPPAARPAGTCFPGPSTGAAFAAWRRDIAIQHGVGTAAHGDGGATAAGAHQCRYSGRNGHAEVSTCDSAMLTPPSEASSQLGALALQQGFAFDPRVASNVCIFHFFFCLSYDSPRYPFSVCHVPQVSQ